MDFFAEIAQLRRTGDYLILLLRAALYRSDPPGLPEGLSWRQVYQLAKFHGMETMALAPAEALVAREDADRAMAALAQAGERAYLIGECVAGEKGIELW